MGVITQISLDEANKLFASYNFIKITPTQNGVMDTTYIVENKNASFILKKYERDIPQKIADDTTLLKKLNDAQLNVPLCLDENEGWHLYTKLQGVHPKSVKSYHIQAVARFLAKLHSELSVYKCNQKKHIDEEILEALHYCKKEHFSYFKKF